VGNEGNGIRDEIGVHIEERIKIPSFAINSKGAASLNVAVAGGIICAEFSRQNAPDYSK
jgi:TrmH family RNA methyltransferase